VLPEVLRGVEHLFDPDPEVLGRVGSRVAGRGGLGPLLAAEGLHLVDLLLEPLLVLVQVLDSAGLAQVVLADQVLAVVLQVSHRVDLHPVVMRPKLTGHKHVSPVIRHISKRAVSLRPL
jgi:hypothetical protein